LQLQAPEGGGGMNRLDRYLGHVELSDPSRLTQTWERQATLRLRLDDITVLTTTANMTGYTRVTSSRPPRMRPANTRHTIRFSGSMTVIIGAVFLIRAHAVGLRSGLLLIPSPGAVI
jgi:hypothetical protein